MEHPAYADHVRVRRSIEKEMAGPADNSVIGSSPFPAMKQMVAAYARAKLKPGYASRTLRIDADIAQCRHQQPLIASACHLAEVTFTPAKHGNDISLSRDGKP